MSLKSDSTIPLAQRNNQTKNGKSLPYSIFIRAIIASLLIVSLPACEQEADERVEKVSFFSFGTLVETNIWGASPEQMQSAITSVQSDLNFMHFAWHAWEPGPIGRTNQLLETTAWFSANPSVIPVISKAKALSLRSKGLFNPAIGQLVQLWGFHSDELPTTPPTDEQIKALLLKKPSMADIEIAGVRMRSTNSAVRLDLGAMAKGYALDEISANLKRLGIQNAIINAGGDLRAFGRPGKRPWKIGIRHPRQQAVIASVEIVGDESVFTSGDYERFFKHNGKRHHHIIDPRTGKPAASTRSVTVIHGEAATADAAATALFVAGPADWPDIARAMGIEQVMLISQEGTVFMTPAMQRRVKFEIAPLDVKVVPLP